jgi:hypothetical protein
VAKLGIQGPLRVVEMTGSWGAYAGERIIVGSGESFIEVVPPGSAREAAG